MEMNAAAILWKRSVKEAKRRYTTLLSDGDGKTHQHLNEIKVYGKNVTIMKEECINHVAKRVGTGLRNVVQDWKKKGVTLGGKKSGSLKDETIKKLQNFYRKTIADNAPDVDKMKSSVFETLHHCISTDKIPHHSKCPVGKNSWCFYQRALSKNEKTKNPFYNENTFVKCGNGENHTSLSKIDINRNFEPMHFSENPKPKRKFA
ncbi:hypothetical protein AVEN_2184-1 [Araneus ventricosus]|uniref:Mutator-like transposase domain-containing protein n=1 Tax=Araneus ventricosus TaxID=182803 RepID=A0A4Y2JB43_ARAVE|nr:hypothetical protein AVEN_2184-1 [Araneus ventricosus]